MWHRPQAGSPLLSCRRSYKGVVLVFLVHATCIPEENSYLWSAYPDCWHVHLLSAVNETLLRRWNTFLLFHALLYPRDLHGLSAPLLVIRPKLPCSSFLCSGFGGGGGLAVAYLVVRLDIELDLLAGECSYSAAPISPSSISCTLQSAAVETYLICILSGFHCRALR